MDIHTYTDRLGRHCARIRHSAFGHYWVSTFAGHSEESLLHKIADSFLVPAYRLDKPPK